MANLVVSPEYLTTLSKQVSEWSNSDVGSAVAAVPGDWTTEGIVGLATGGAAAIAVGGMAAYKYSDFAAKKFTVKGTSFTGEEVVLIASLAATGYSIYSDLASGNYWAAALDTLSLVPQGINLAMTHSGLNDLIKTLGTTTVILQRTGTCLQGLNFTVGLANDVGEDFTDGAEQFNNGSAAVRQLMPTSEWTGIASDSYAETVVQLQTLMGDMARVDAQMADVFRAEMDQLIITRNLIATARKLIEVAIPIAIALDFIPEIGPEISEAFQVSVAAIALSTAVGAIASQMLFSADNGAQVDTQKAEYEAVQKRADALYAKLQPAPPATSPSAGVQPSPTGTGGASGSSVNRDAAQSSAGRRSTSGSGSRDSADAGEVPAASGGRRDYPVGGGAPAGVIGGMPTVASGQSGSGQTVSSGGKAARHSASVKPDTGAAADKAGAAEADAGPYAQAAAGGAIAERAPVDTETSARKETREGSTLDRTSESKP
ncbi:EspA/EspE family type VII secretion system effector [Mycobacterium sp. Aquia_216]|uniref:EspA/EspE family type VII secretion system effector n=1 Tax=Mycobacterium sp. Aquia_216 TaxID=2991729 RepID=UPI00227CA7B0|nr:EspA/EspE family type VII secretion system effector [Mycobacterium sp. Aquia_216]WAJ45419.1 EspA/EspE family type VII secretion system effector [Mycobacterium sp. Aquia_216]